MKIAIAFNLKKPAQNPHPEDAFEEFDAPETIEALASVFRSKGHEVVPIEAGGDFISRLTREKPDFVFNLAEGYAGRMRESLVPAILEFLGIPHSGSDGLALALSLDKSLTKMIATHHGVRTPEFWVIDPGQSALRGVRFPSFVKPACEGSSKGIRLTSLVKSVRELRKECGRLWKNYGAISLLAERYIPGREITVGVLGTETPRVLGMMEIRWKDAESHRGEFIYSLEVKRNWREWVEYQAPPRLARSTFREIGEMALKIHRTLGCRDISRIDFRVDEKRVPYFLEINPLPGLSPDYSDLVIMMRSLGMTHRQLVLAIFREACKRYRKHKSRLPVWSRRPLGGSLGIC